MENRNICYRFDRLPSIVFRALGRGEEVGAKAVLGVVLSEHGRIELKRRLMSGLTCPLSSYSANPGECVCSWLSTCEIQICSLE